MNWHIKVSLLDKNRTIKVTLLTDLSKEVYWHKQAYQSNFTDMNRTIKVSLPDMYRTIKVSLLDKNRSIKVTLLTDLLKEVYWHKQAYQSNFTEMNRTIKVSLLT